MHQLEFSADEVFYTNATLRTGVRKFYNTAGVGLNPQTGNNLWHISYGIGTNFKIKNNLFSDICLSQQHISKGKFNLKQSELIKLHWGLEYKFKNLRPI